jgi:hypothetical protein
MFYSHVFWCHPACSTVRCFDVALHVLQSGVLMSRCTFNSRCFDITLHVLQSGVLMSSCTFYSQLFDVTLHIPQSVSWCHPHVLQSGVLMSPCMFYSQVFWCHPHVLQSPCTFYSLVFWSHAAYSIVTWFDVTAHRPQKPGVTLQPALHFQTLQFLHAGHYYICGRRSPLKFGTDCSCFALAVPLVACAMLLMAPPQ